MVVLQAIVKKELASKIKELAEKDKRSVSQFIAIMLEEKTRYNINKISDDTPEGHHQEPKATRQL